MAAHSMPLEDLQKVSRFARAIGDYPLQSAWPVVILRFYHLPTAIETLTRELSGTRTGSLTAAEARSLYDDLLPVYQGLQGALERFRRRRLCRIIARPWLKRLEDSAEDLADLLDTLAWGSDPELQQFMDAAISRLERRTLRQCQSG